MRSGSETQHFTIVLDCLNQEASRKQITELHLILTEPESQECVCEYVCVFNIPKLILMELRPMHGNH